MIEFHLPDMTCGHCESVVRKTLSLVDDEAQIQVDLPQQRVRIDSEASADELARALSDAGYPPAT